MESCPKCGWIKPERLTASPSGVTIWVQKRDDDGLEVLLRPRNTEENDEAARSVRDGWTRLDRVEWETLRNCVDSYFRALETVTASAPHGPSTIDHRKGPRDE